MAEETKLDQAEWDRFCEASRIFYQKFESSGVPLNATLFNSLQSDEEKKLALGDLQGTCIVLIDKVRALLEAFLNVRRLEGTEKERRLYENMKWDDLAKRLIEKRPFAFVGGSDRSLLRDMSYAENIAYKINTSEEEERCTFEEYINYEEMALSALIGVSSSTFFYNNGSRSNRGEAGAAGEFTRRGVIVGLVGARFERGDVMESRFMLIRSDNSLNISDNMRKIWADFYQAEFYTFEEAQDYEQKSGESRFFFDQYRGFYFDKLIFKKRIEVSVLTLFHEANRRAEIEKKRAYVHLVGLGLGVWQACSIQTQLFVDAVAEVLENTEFPHIADVDFSWFGGMNQCGSAVNGQDLNNVTIHFSQRNPSALIDDPNKLLVVSYAWDSNSLPGNEYWWGALDASGDPAAACSSSIAEVQNPHINPRFLENIQVLPPPPQPTQ